jgi:aspartyl/glutamyl-tRNA(Asn/Gln) amidotransferase C subunit
MDRDEVIKLSKLARIEIGDTEAEKLSKEFGTILSYVGEVQGIVSNKLGSKIDVPIPHNMMREDGEPHESGLYTEAILANAPAREGDYVKVKNIL